jgi:hypothetical protein
MKLFSPFLVLAALAAVLLTSCGSVSEFNPQTDNKYSKVSVRDFSYTGDPEETFGPNSKTVFPQRLVEAIQDTNNFSQVQRGGTVDSQTLVIDGQITSLVEGAASLRLFVGFGAGRSYFTGTVNFRDGTTSKTIGQMTIDKASYGAGGSIAAIQDPNYLMRVTAEKIAEEIAKVAATPQAN